jgi:hypothetical protein
MESVANDLCAALEAVVTLRQIDETNASIRPGPGQWSKKEILGHLIDSAANNHQRFVWLQLMPRIDLRQYDGDAWVRVQRYQDRSWREVVDLWEMYNTQLAYLIRHVDSNALRNTWDVPDGTTQDLEFIMRDYVVHLRHHLDQIL